MSDVDTTNPPRTRRLSFWLLLFGVSFLVSLGLCGISMRANDVSGPLALFSFIGMALSIGGFAIALFVATLSALVSAVKR